MGREGVGKGEKGRGANDSCDVVNSFVFVVVAMKFFAPWCRSCKALEPKFKRVTAEPYSSHVKFAQFNVQNNRDFVKSLGILALPSVHFYSREGILDAFPCGPSKVPILKSKLKAVVKERVDEEVSDFPLPFFSLLLRFSHPSMYARSLVF